jgi:hypothetical protein
MMSTLSNILKVRGVGEWMVVQIVMPSVLVKFFTNCITSLAV